MPYGSKQRPEFGTGNVPPTVPLPLVEDTTGKNASLGGLHIYPDGKIAIEKQVLEAQPGGWPKNDSDDLHSEE
jgi:hypothetical protein